MHEKLGEKGRGTIEIGVEIGVDLCMGGMFGIRCSSIVMRASQLSVRANLLVHALDGGWAAGL